MKNGDENISENKYEKNRNRKVQVIVRLNEKEFDRLCDKAASCGLDRSKYIRMLIRDVRPVECPPVDYDSFMTELRKLGVNMNQLATKAHSLGFIDEPEYRRNASAVWKVCSDIRQQFAMRGGSSGDNKNMGG